jgi:hypothetical protein
MGYLNLKKEWSLMELGSLIVIIFSYYGHCLCLTAMYCEEKPIIIETGDLRVKVLGFFSHKSQRMNFIDNISK